MSSYSCPDCSADLVPKIRIVDLELDDGEIANYRRLDRLEPIDGDQIFITGVVCSNGCGAETDDSAAPPRPGVCNYPGCDQPATRKRGRSPVATRCAEHSKLKVEAGK